MKKLLLISYSFLFFFLASANAADRALPKFNTNIEKDSIPHRRHFQINTGFNLHGAILFGGGEDTELRLGYFSGAGRFISRPTSWVSGWAPCILILTIPTPDRNGKRKGTTGTSKHL